MQRYLFVDGASLKSTFKNHEIVFDHGPMQVSPDNLASGYHRVFYYDALPAPRNNPPDANDEKRMSLAKDEHDRLREASRFYVRTGETRYSPKQGQRQKGVDVLLALDAYQQAASGNVDEIHLVVSDLDFLPLLEALLHTKALTRLYYDPKRTTDILRYSADETEPLKPSKTLQWSNFASIPELKLQLASPAAFKYVNPTSEVQGTVGGRPVTLVQFDQNWRTWSNELDYSYHAPSRALLERWISYDWGDEFIANP